MQEILSKKPLLVWPLIAVLPWLAYSIMWWLSKSPRGTEEGRQAHAVEYAIWKVLPYFGFAVLLLCAFALRRYGRHAPTIAGVAISGAALIIILLTGHAQ